MIVTYFRLETGLKYLVPVRSKSDLEFVHAAHGRADSDSYWMVPGTWSEDDFVVQRNRYPMFRIVRANTSALAYCAQRADTSSNGVPNWRTLIVLGEENAQDWLAVAEGKMTREAYEKNNRRRYRKGLQERKKNNKIGGVL